MIPVLLISNHVIEPRFWDSLRNVLGLLVTVSQSSMWTYGHMLRPEGLSAP